MSTLDERVTDLSANLARNPVTDDIILKKNEAAIKQHIDMLLLSDEYACIGRPHVCVGLKKFINEPATDGKIAELKNRIREAMRHESRVSVDSLEVTFDTNSKYCIVTMTLTFTNTDRSFTYETRLRRIL
ncbi:putative base plate wedge subunit [Sinorhizobium phage phiM9]|uniref:Putative base plate wedge subunit n=1 Tax=Sinorhizobium phage phiM9 TaxID=1636182 RepID=A0A0F6TGM0_9CAUD|nr:putative base plate wedge subunit [Sinorhizobium phage phiM9]AKE44711.1 putative base plate wedge subunit [Sinorhizobium phage phiM9]